MTDKQQPPTHVWLSRHWASYTEHSCQFSCEQKYPDDIEFVPRVREVDDARVEEIRERLSKMGQFGTLSVGLTPGSHRSFVIVKGDVGLEANCGVVGERNSAKAEFFANAPSDIQYLLSLLPQLSRSEHKHHPHAQPGRTTPCCICDGGPCDTVSRCTCICHVLINHCPRCSDQSCRAVPVSSSEPRSRLKDGAFGDKARLAQEIAAALESLAQQQEGERAD
jgi:hypothetical protein